MLCFDEECAKESKWKDHVPKLFSNIHLIVAINEELLGGLAELIGSWDTSKSLVGPIFQKMAPFMRLYNTYGNSYNEAIALLQKLREKDDFTQFLNQCRGSQPLDLEVLFFLLLFLFLYCLGIGVVDSACSANSSISIVVGRFDEEHAFDASRQRKHGDFAQAHSRCGYKRQRVY